MSGTKEMRVALVVGTLGQGGAEKQLVYMAQALQQMGVHVRIYCLTKGEYYEAALRNINLSPCWIGKVRSPFWRLIKLIAELRDFQPAIVQSSHFYTNLYAALAAPFCNAVGVGNLRNDGFYEVQANGFWGMKLLQTPLALLANSHAAKRNAALLGVQGDRVFLLPNAIDLVTFDRMSALDQASLPSEKNLTQVNVVAVGNLVPTKRFDRFLRALAKARSETPILRGFIIGDGEERRSLEQLAESLGLFPNGICFVGRSDNIPSLLSQADLLVLSSDNEGMPNVILEAMAASLPVITTPAGDAGVVVKHGVTGYVVPFDNADALASRMVSLAASQELRQKLGEAGRRDVERNYSHELLGGRLLKTYAEIESRFGGPSNLNASEISFRSN